jgi:uncharacterized Zn finger protein
MPEQPKLSIADSVGIVCEECANNTFEEVFFARKFSKFLTGTPKDVISTVPVLKCSKCGHINDSMNPLKTLLGDEEPV